MNVAEHLQEFDGLILDLTRPPATATLRNKLVTIRDQIEALEAAYATLKNAHTVFKNQTEQKIADLEESNRNAVSQKAAVNLELAASKDGTTQKKPALGADTVRVLVSIFEWEGPVTHELVALQCNLGLNRVRYHFGVLEERYFLLWNQTIDHAGHTEYVLTQDGRAYVIEHESGA